MRELSPAQRPPFVDGQLARFEAHLAARAADEDTAERQFRRSAASVREIGTLFWLAVVLLEHGEWLAASERGDDAEPLLAEARAIFERLEAAPWLERLDAVAVPVRA